MRTNIIKRSLLLLGLILLSSCREDGIGSAYRQEIEAWRTERVADLTAPDGWLALEGLFWLEDGASNFGSAEDNALVFPAGAPGHLGRFILENDSVWVDIPDQFPVLDQDSMQVRRRNLARADYETIMNLGSLSWFVITRGGKYGIRLRDAQSEHIRSFEGIDYFDIDTSWRVEARFIPLPSPDTLIVRNVVDMDIPLPSEGKLEFERDGRLHTLKVLDGGPDEFFLIFTDHTTGEETYPAGRYLYTPRPDSTGMTFIDFNKAYNPPCAFTEFATCLLPPQENRLDLAVRAGERNYGEH